MSRPKPDPCPLCGTEAVVIRPDSVSVVWNIACDDWDGCGLILYGGEGKSLRVMVDRWNKRMPQTVIVDPQLLRDLRNPPDNRVWADLMIQAADLIEGRPPVPTNLRSE